MKTKIYGAYGSNINLEQMAYRCPHAEVYKVGYINGYRLTFRSGGFANIEKSEGDRVPVEIDNGEDTIEAMFYVMDDKYCQKMQTPTEYYYGGIERGYKSNGMPVEELKTAFERCMAEVN